MNESWLYKHKAVTLIQIETFRNDKIINLHQTLKNA